MASFFAKNVMLFPEQLSGGTERPSAPVIAEMYGLPPMPGRNKPAVYRSSGSAEVIRLDGASADDFSAYLELLVAAGHTVYDSRCIEDNRFATLTGGNLTVNLSWFPGTKTMRLVAEKRGPLCPLADVCEEKYDTLLTGIKGETCVAAEGMGYVIRLCDGSFCVIDGGMGDPDHADSDRLMGILDAQKPEGSGRPVIAAWIFTHLHGDHVGVFNCFSLDHANDVVLEKLIYNFPREDEIAASDSPYMLDDSIYRWNQFKKNLRDFYSGVPVIKVHTGNRFVIRNARFDVLFALDDLYPQSILDGNGLNESSLLLKMTACGQTFLWTGDLGFIAADLVVREYTRTLACDALQLAHHGWNGTAALYGAVDPSYVLWPVSFDTDLDRCLSAPRNAVLRDSPKVRQFIVTNRGTWTLKIPYAPAPGTFERIPSERTVYPAYPRLLGE